MKIKYWDESDFGKIHTISKDRNLKVGYFDNCVIDGISSNYPNILIRTEDEILLPTIEMFMSLGRRTVYEDGMGMEWNSGLETSKSSKIENHSVFYFVYNCSNYFHWLYDTVPYLYTYFLEKQRDSNLKLLVGLPVGKNDLYPFVYETLELLGISKEDLIFVNKNTLYKRIIVGSSLTHNRQSQNPPHNAIYDIFDRLKDAVSDEIDSDRIYVSRRTWHDTDAGNIGTDYTKERMCVNENKVVEIFKEFDFNEVFCEKLSMRSKISLFKSADYIAGPIGGGLSNVLFSNSSTKVISIDSPEFFEINKRLQYAMSHTKLYHFDNTSFVDRKEPIEISDYSLSISGGMNSHWQVDTNKLYAYLKNTIK